MTASQLKIEGIASDILLKNNLFTVPIKVKSIPGFYGIKLEEIHLGSDVSGVLHSEESRVRIGYSALESKVRQRFTIAHELGHFFLHLKGSDKGLFIDNKKRMYRSSSFSPKEQKRETEANNFAAALLMPQKLLVEKANTLVDNFPFISDEEIISNLAKGFKVSEIAMTYRLNKLKLLL